MTAFFLDFDGVLFDSLPEAYRLARCAYRGTDVRAPADAREFACFSRLRFLITRSEQYWRLFRLIEIHGNAASIDVFRDGYAQLVRGGDEDAMRAFDENFLSLRKKLIGEEHDFWLSLSAPFPFFTAIKHRFDGAFPPIIVTTKNREAVLENLAREGVRGVPEKILDKADCARFGGKRALIADYMARERIADGIFIDDSAENIRECSALPQLRCLLADWGYRDPKIQGESLEKILTQIEK